MSRFFRPLKYIPWLVLGQIAALAVLILVVFEGLVWALVNQVPLVRNLLNVILTSPVNPLFFLAIAFAVGAIAVLLLERLRRDVIITAGNLWALVLCLLLLVALRSLLPIQPLVGENETTLIGVIMGVFWQGRRYWR
jgi:hypothetical protein